MERAWTSEGIARWRQIADILRTDIAGRRVTGQLATEADLAVRFAANRHTVRRALAALASDGLVRAERGRGTFVNTPDVARLSYPVGAMTRFSENVGATSREPGGRLIGSSVEIASLLLSQALNCRPGVELTRMEMLRVASGAPVLVSTHWFVATRVPGLVAAYAEIGTLTGALAKVGIGFYRRMTTRVTAESADPSDARLLDIPPGTPILQVMSVDCIDKSEPLQTARTRFAGSRIELVFDHGDQWQDNF